jgi:predicted esterase
MQDQWIRDIKSSDPKVRRRAIVAMANAQDGDAIKLLKFLYENDPDPSNRELAHKAAKHLWQFLQQQQNGVPEEQTQEPEQSPMVTGTAVQDAQPVEQTTASQVAANQQQIESARLHLNRALSLLVKEDLQGSSKSLRQALSLDPNLEHDQIAINLAREITGLPEKEALAAMRQRQAPLATASQNKRPTAPRSRTSLYLLIIAGLVLIAAVLYFIFSGTAATYTQALTRAGYEQQKIEVNGYEVYVIPPKGSTPEGGWPVVVAFHGYGGSGNDMLSLASQFTSQGIVYVAPSFGEYQPMPGDGPIQPMAAILNQINQDYPIQQRGVVLLGFSQGGSFAYRFSVMQPEHVAGVVTAGAPDFDDILPASQTQPYVFFWGSEDGLQDFVVPASVTPLINQGYNVKYQIIAGAGHEVTPEAIAMAIQMALEK